MLLYFLSKPPWDTWIYLKYLSIIIITNQVGSTPCVHLNIYDKSCMFSGVWKELAAVHLTPVILFLLLSPLIEFTQASCRPPPPKKRAFGTQGCPSQSKPGGSRHVEQSSFQPNLHPGKGFFFLKVPFHKDKGFHKYWSQRCVYYAFFWTSATY